MDISISEDEQSQQDDPPRDVSSLPRCATHVYVHHDVGAFLISYFLTNCSIRNTINFVQPY